MCWGLGAGGHLRLQHIALETVAARFDCSSGVGNQCFGVLFSQSSVAEVMQTSEVIQEPGVCQTITLLNVLVSGFTITIDGHDLFVLFFYIEIFIDCES